MDWLKRLFGRGVRRGGEIAPDEIFIDASNLPSFDRGRFEGRLERPIGTMALAVTGIAVVATLSIFGWRLYTLQVVRGAEYAHISENNRLSHTVIFAERGVVYDRNGIELVWNVPLGEGSSATTTMRSVDTLPSSRAYIDAPGFAHLLGYVSLPKRDAHGFWYQTEIEGVTGVEAAYDELLGGENGLQMVETDAIGRTQSEAMLSAPHNGKALTLSIDAELQKGLAQALIDTAASSKFEGAAGIIMDVHSGEIIAMVSYPEYNPRALAAATSSAALVSYQNDPRSPFLNRVVGGRYTPGSIVKPFMASAALAEGIIDPKKEIISTGVLRVPNPYYPELVSTFVDWRAHGAVDMRHAIAVSSNIYFYYVGGGYGSQEGLGISRIEKYMRAFGIGEPSGIALEGEQIGVIPNPAWKQEIFDDIWRLGDTYNTAIGQYGFQVTPISMVRAVAALANNGTLVTPTVLKGNSGPTQRVPGVTPEQYQIVREGMRMSVTGGTAAALNFPFVSVAGKTGTAQVGARNEYMHSWVVGFFPYESPRYAFVTLMEKGPAGTLYGAPSAMYQFFMWARGHRPEYFGAEAAAEE